MLKYAEIKILHSISKVNQYLTKIFLVKNPNHTSFLHEDKKLIKKLLSLRVTVQFIELQQKDKHPEETSQLGGEGLLFMFSSI